MRKLGLVGLMLALVLGFGAVVGFLLYSLTESVEVGVGAGIFVVIAVVIIGVGFYVEEDYTDDIEMTDH